MYHVKPLIHLVQSWACSEQGGQWFSRFSGRNLSYVYLECPGIGCWTLCMLSMCSVIDGPVPTFLLPPDSAMPKMGNLHPVGRWIGRLQKFHHLPTPHLPSFCSFLSTCTCEWLQASCWHPWQHTSKCAAGASFTIVLQCRTLEHRPALEHGKRHWNINQPNRTGW